MSQGLGKASRTVSGGVSRVAGAVVGGSESAYRGTVDVTRRATARAAGSLRSAGNLIEDNPMAAGAIAIGLGALVALLMPSSRRERQLLGEASDEVKAKVRSTVSDQVERAKDLAGAAADAALQAAREKVATTDIRGSVTDKVEKVKDLAGAAADAALRAAREKMSGAAENERAKETSPRPAEANSGQPSRVRNLSDSPLTTDPEAAVAIDLSLEDEKTRREKV